MLMAAFVVALILPLLFRMVGLHQATQLHVQHEAPSEEAPPPAKRERRRSLLLRYNNDAGME
jgi:hypothetical protein